MDSDLLEAIEDSLKVLPGGWVAVAFSGGLDSSILAKLLEGRSRLYTVGTWDSQDMSEGVSLADAHGWDVLPIVLDEEMMKCVISKIAPILSSPSPMTLNFNVPLYISAQTACEKVVVSGHGADELFGGYNRYSRMDEEKFLKASMKDVENLMEGDLQDSRNLVASTGHCMETPYLSRMVIDKAFSLSATMRRDKKALREIAKNLGLEVFDRKKKAAQFGSSAAKLLRNIARAQGCSETELVAKFAGMASSAPTK